LKKYASGDATGQARLEAFVYTLLNMFEVVFTFFEDNPKLLKTEKATWEQWDRQLRGFKGLTKFVHMKSRKKAAEFRGILFFLLLSFAGGWLISLPLWLDEKGLQHPLASLLLPGMMAIPSAATLLVVFCVTGR
jgi:hypothetical protein